MDQLGNRNPTQEDLKFLLFSELLDPLFNKEAKHLFEKAWKPASEGGEDNALGHSLNTGDLKKILIQTRNTMQLREYTRRFNQSFDGKKDIDKQKKEEEKKRKDTFLGSNQTMGQEGQGQRRSQMPTNGKNTCPIPKCGASLDHKEGGHSFILKCPMMKQMPTEELWSWFCSKKCQCLKCFATDHKSQDCNLTRFRPCNKTLMVGDNAGKVCGSNEHCIWLHREKKPKGKKKEGNISNQTMICLSCGQAIARI